MQVRVYRFGTRNRAAAIALIAAALAIGAVLIAFGLMLLLGLTAVAGVVGAGAVLYHRITGRRPVLHRWESRLELDPSLEVFPAELQQLPQLPAKGSEERLDRR